MRKLREHGIAVNGSFVFGYDGDNQASFEETLCFAIDKKMFVSGFNHLMAYPGTALYDRLPEEGRLLYGK